MPHKSQIDFSDRDYNSRPRRSRPSGLQEDGRQWEEDYGYPADNRYPYNNDYPAEDDYRDDSGYYQDAEYQDTGYRDERYPRQKPAARSGYDSYRDGYRDGYRDNAAGAYQRRDDYSQRTGMNFEEGAEKAKNFIGRHPVLMNFIYVCLAAVMFVVLLLWFLDFWTFHGQERFVPDVKGQSFEMAEGNIARAGLRCVVTDSVYESFQHPGTVVEQMPIPSARIKKGGTVYVTIVAYSPKMVTIPNFYDVSERQARSMLEGLGIKQIMTVNVPSEYQGLVMGARFNGVSLSPGAKVPVTAIITLEVGGGNADTEFNSVTDNADIVDEESIEETINTLDLD